MILISIISLQLEVQTTWRVETCEQVDVTTLVGVEESVSVWLSAR